MYFCGMNAECVCHWPLKTIDDTVTTMNMTTDCLLCSIRQIDTLLKNMDIGEETRLRHMQELLRILAEIDASMSPPAAAAVFHARIKQLTGIDDPFEGVKRDSNAIALGVLSEVRSIVNGSRQPLASALLASVAGNIIDYGVRDKISKADIINALYDSLDGAIGDGFVARFENDMKNSTRILFVCDNAGEIVFDRLLIEKMPAEKITVAVRGFPIINDATFDDARQAGLDSMVRVITTGDATPGIDIGRSSEEFMEAFASSEMIIFKGQGNLETMLHADVSNFVKDGATLYFLLKIKCGRVAELLHKKINDNFFFAKET